MSDKKTIYAKIAKVMSQVERVPKNGYNNFHKYEYATESDLTEAIRPILQEAGLAFFSTVIEQERDGEFTKAKMEFTLADVETGETLTSTYWGEGQDKGDKGLYKAYTGAVKYFLMKTFLIPTGDDPEADEQQKPQGQQPPQSRQQKKQLSDKQVKRLYAIANSSGFTTEDVKKVLMKDYNKTQAADLTKQEYEEICDRLQKKEGKAS